MEFLRLTVVSVSEWVVSWRQGVCNSGSWKKMPGAEGKVDMFYSQAFWTQPGFLTAIHSWIFLGYNL